MNPRERINLFLEWYKTLRARYVPGVFFTTEYNVVNCIIWAWGASRYYHVDGKYRSNCKYSKENAK